MWHCAGDEGATLLAQKLSGNGLLVTLDVGSNGIGDVGAAALAEGLKLNTTLQKIDLRCVDTKPEQLLQLMSVEGTGRDVLDHPHTSQVQSQTTSTAAFPLSMLLCRS